MKKTAAGRRVALIVLIAIAACALLLLLSMKTLLFLPEGAHLFDSPSPDGKHCVSVYLCNGGATVDFAVRCEVSGAGMLPRNLYWAYHERTAAVEWQSDRVCVINGVVLDIYGAPYDYRRGLPG